MRLLKKTFGLSKGPLDGRRSSNLERQSTPERKSRGTFSTVAYDFGQATQRSLRRSLFDFCPRRKLAPGDSLLAQNGSSLKVHATRGQPRRLPSRLKQGNATLHPPQAPLLSRPSLLNCGDNPKECNRRGTLLRCVRVSQFRQQPVASCIQIRRTICEYASLGHSDQCAMTDHITGKPTDDSQPTLPTGCPSRLPDICCFSSGEAIAIY